MRLLGDESAILGDDPCPPMPSQLPHVGDDEPLGINCYKCGFDEPLDLSNLTLRRTFFGRSELRHVSFEGTDLGESNLCWNDFVDVSFANADLSRCDLRASKFECVSFAGAVLTGADLRQSSFAECSFEGARMDGAVLTQAQGSSLGLSEQQRSSIAWSAADGPAPPGG